MRSTPGTPTERPPTAASMKRQGLAVSHEAIWAARPPAPSRGRRRCEASSRVRTSRAGTRRRRCRRTRARPGRASSAPRPPRPSPSRRASAPPRRPRPRADAPPPPGSAWRRRASRASAKPKTRQQKKKDRRFTARRRRRAPRRSCPVGILVMALHPALHLGDVPEGVARPVRCLAIEALPAPLRLHLERAELARRNLDFFPADAPSPCARAGRGISPARGRRISQSAGYVPPTASGNCNRPRFTSIMPSSTDTTLFHSGVKVASESRGLPCLEITVWIARESMKLTRSS